jgi:hypothetical protein
MRFGRGLSALLSAVLLAGALDTAHAVTMDKDGRLTVADFAVRQGENPAVAQKRFSATGIVTCGSTHSTAQLTVRSDIITTAAHAFYAPSGQLRANPSSCVFVIELGSQTIEVPVLGETLRVGSNRPYDEPGVKDWAVVRLSKAVEGVTPYKLAATPSSLGDILLVANRHQGWVHDGHRAVEACAIRNAVKTLSSAPRELAIDCSTGQGASGSALMLPGAPGVMIGIYVGWRSAHPNMAGPYATNHLNYGLAIEGPFWAAIQDIAR